MVVLVGGERAVAATLSSVPNGWAIRISRNDSERRRRRPAARRYHVRRCRVAIGILQTS